VRGFYNKAFKWWACNRSIKGENGESTKSRHIGHLCLYSGSKLHIVLASVQVHKYGTGRKKPACGFGNNHLDNETSGQRYLRSCSTKKIYVFMGLLMKPTIEYCNASYEGVLRANLPNPDR